MTVFNPHFSISIKTANALVRIEAVRQRIDFLPIHPSILLSLRESAKLQYYAKNLPAYYDAISIGPSHNYYMGRADADITKWVEYFCLGMAESFEAIARRAEIGAKQGVSDQYMDLRTLDAMQRKCLELLQKSNEIASSDIQALFNYKPRSATALLSGWVSEGFLVITDPSRRTRKYGLSESYKHLLD